MAIEIKQENKIWTVEVNEKFAFESFDKMQRFVRDMLNVKKKYGNYTQLKKMMQEGKLPFKKKTIEEIGIEIDMNKIKSAEDFFNQIDAQLEKKCQCKSCQTKRS